jgi:hypothetical protein
VVRRRGETDPGVRFSGPVQSALREAAENDEAVYEILPKEFL